MNEELTKLEEELAELRLDYKMTKVECKAIYGEQVALFARLQNVNNEAIAKGEEMFQKKQDYFQAKEQYEQKKMECILNRIAVGSHVEVLFDDGEYYQGVVTWQHRNNKASVKVLYDSDGKVWHTDLNDGHFRVMNVEREVIASTEPNESAGMKRNSSVLGSNQDNGANTQHRQKRQKATKWYINPMEYFGKFLY